MEIKVCQNCGKEFRATHKNNIFYKDEECIRSRKRQIAAQVRERKKVMRPNRNKPIERIANNTCPKDCKYLEVLWGKDWFSWEKDGKDVPKIHPAQKPVTILKKLIEIFTDEGDVVIDPCAGSGSTGRACAELGRNFYGFEISKDFYSRAVNEMLNFETSQLEIRMRGFEK